MNVTPDFWSSIPSPEMLDSEANVEHRHVLPLLHALGYGSDDIESKYSVEFQEGRRGRKPEADFVCFYGALRDKDNSLLVVEVKASSEALPAGQVQGESYAQNLRAPLLLLTNGAHLEVWQMQISMESECVLQIPVTKLSERRGDVERLLNKIAVRDYCRELKFKTIIEATSDFGTYETAELIRLKADPCAIERTLHFHQEDGKPIYVESIKLLKNYPSGAVVIAPSGYGKTTLSRSILKQAIEERWHGRHNAVAFEASSPDLEESGADLISFLHQRVTAHQPGITQANFQDSIRKFGATVICDRLDRTSHDFRKRMSTAISLFLRDYPLSQVFIFSRAHAKPATAIPTLELAPLSDTQVLDLEKVILTGSGIANNSMIFIAPPTLIPLFKNPLLLRLTLQHWIRKHDFPRNIDILFRSWLEAVLETEPNDLVSRTHREKALSIIAQATTDTPLSGAKAIALLKVNGISEGVLNELIQCNAIRETDAVLEVQHDGLADYLRAKTFAERSIQDQLDALPNLTPSPDSFLPVLLMAQLADRDAQDALWRRLTSGSIGNYLDALRYRRDASDDLSRLEPGEFSSRYLTDLLNGIEEPLDGFFPAFRSSIVEWLTDERGKPLSIIGLASTHSISYKIHSQQPNEPRVAVGVPEFPGTIRTIDLNLTRHRADSARLVGMTLLKDGLKEVIENLDFSGGPLWSAERLIARMRLLAKRYNLDFSEKYDLSYIENIIKPHADRYIQERRPFGRERFSIRSMLDDIDILRTSGITTLDPWWLRLGWKDDTSLVSNDEIAQILNEEYRRVQLLYTEIVNNSLERFKNELIFFPILPIRWNLTVVRRDSFRRTFVIFPRWEPIRDWRDAGADVTFAEKGPDRHAPWEETRDKLIALGRPVNIPRYGGFTTHAAYDGAKLDGSFSGATPVTNEVISWLRDELRGMFKNLPSGDGTSAV